MPVAIEKKAEYDRLWRKKNPEKTKAYATKYRKAHPEKSRARTKRFADKRRHFLQAVKKAAGCAVCSRNEYAGGLDFHHIDPKTKNFELGCCGKSWDAIVDELDKCEVLCRYCHGAVESRELEWPAKI
jgi:hypothetical protein